MPIKVKKEHLSTVVGFNGSALPLGERKDLHILLDDAIGPNNEPRSKYILSFFEELPTKAEIKAIKEGNFLSKAKAITTHARPDKRHTAKRENQKRTGE